MSSNITKADVIAKFKQLHKTHYYPYGYMIHTISDSVSEQFFKNADWYHNYNRNASSKVPIRSLNATLSIEGNTFKIGFDRPLVKDEQYEFESYFGFGDHCDGYTEIRTIMRFAEKKDEAKNIEKLLLLNGNSTDAVNEEYLHYVCLVLILGGYVKFWKAIDDFEKWCLDAQIINPNSNMKQKVFEYIFEKVELNQC